MLQGWRGGGLRERRRTGPLVSPEGCRAAGCCGLVLSDPLLAVGEVLGRLPRVGRRGVALLPHLAHQVVGPAADRLAVEELRHHVLPRLPRIGDRSRGGGPARPNEVGLEQVDVDRRTALKTRKEGQRVCVGAGDRSHVEGALPVLPPLP